MSATSVNPALACALLSLCACSSGAQCLPEWSGVGGGLDGGAIALLAHDDDGQGPRGRAMFVGGGFTQAGPQQALLIARWDGASWSALGGGLNGVSCNALAAWDHDGLPGTHAVLVAAGGFHTAGGQPADNIATWDGSVWSALGPGLDGVVMCLGTWDPDGPGGNPEMLVAGGSFLNAGATPVNRLALHDGMSWSGAGGGVTSQFATVETVASFDVDGPGPNPPRLFIGGFFTLVGGVGINHVAMWDGQAWSNVGLAGGFDRRVLDFAVYDEDGPAGPQPEQLFCSGDFTIAGGLPANRVARLDAVMPAWEPLGNGLSGGIKGGGTRTGGRAMTVHDPDGVGVGRPRLYIGGNFTLAGGEAAANIVSWDGGAFARLGDGTSSGAGLPFVQALASLDEDGAGPQPPALYVGGSFDAAGGVLASFIARWGCPVAAPCYADCDGDGALTLADFGCFQTRFALSDPYADCNGDAALNLADFGCFQTAFAQGCP